MVLVEKAILVALALDAAAAIAVPLLYRQSLRGNPTGAARPRPSDDAEAPRSGPPGDVRRAGPR